MVAVNVIDLIWIITTYKPRQVIETVAFRQLQFAKWEGYVQSLNTYLFIYTEYFLMGEPVLE